MSEFNELDREGLMSKSVYEEIYALEDQHERQEKKMQLLCRAKALGMASSVKDTLKIYDREEREKQNKKKSELVRRTEITQFSDDLTGKNYPQMYCGSWVANDNGICATDQEKLGSYACPHPIIPVKRLRNMEDGKEQITLAFKRGGMWSELTFPKSMIAKASTIVELADYGVSVTSENAKLLVKYLQDIEINNEDYVVIQQSTGKFGWRRSATTKELFFLPYDDENIFFDGEYKFPGLHDSITQSGSFKPWLEHMKKLRAKKYLEPRLSLAASFASVIIELTGTQSFLVDFWGSTEGGKTVTLMVAASVWGDPTEGRYIGNFKSTAVSLETRSDLLNNLPLILDDSSNSNRGVRENFEELVYSLCSGKGKSRSNKSLGADRERNWHNITITSGERPMHGYVSQGGAFNRIISVECSNKIFDDPKETAELVRNEYGYAGQVFVSWLKQKYMSSPDGIERLKSIIKKYEAELSNFDGMQKQINAASALLAADEIATEALFQDGNNLSTKDIQNLLVNRSAVEEGLKAYQLLLDTLEISGQHFSPEFGGIDQWGEVDKGKNEIYFYPTALDRILSDNGFYRKQFASWASNKGLLVCEKGRDTKTARLPSGSKKRIFCLKIDYDILDKNTEESSEELVFD